MQVANDTKKSAPAKPAAEQQPVDQYHETLLRMAEAKELADRYHARTIGQWKSRPDMEAISGAHPEQFQREMDVMGHFFFISVRMTDRGPEFRIERDPLVRMQIMANRLGNLFRNYTNECDFVYWMIHAVSKDIPPEQIQYVAVPHL